MRQQIDGLGVDVDAASVSTDCASDSQSDSLMLVTKGLGMVSGERKTLVDGS